MNRKNNENSLKVVISKELRQGEQVLWLGQPKQGLMFRSTDIFLIPFSILWGGFAIFWEVSVLQELHSHNQSILHFFPVFGIPFVVIGLYLIFGRFWADAKVRSKTVYGLTNSRVIIVSGLFAKKVQSLSIANQGDISLEEKSDGRGSVLFGTNSIWNQQQFSITGGSKVPKLENIENPRRVYELILAQR